MRALPFLYLPDAVTLVLLMLVLSELRKIAISHVRQELLIIRKEMLTFWLNNGLDRADEGYLALRGLIDSSIRLAPRLSPARLVFVWQLQKRMTRRGHPPPFPDERAAWLRLGRIANQSSREKLRRLALEMTLALGTFVLIGSISGWAILLLVLPKMIRRSFAHRSGHRVDVFFDMAERMLSRVGRRAQEIGFAGQGRE
jgi:hypothetical protein